jgi:hypothetical protein
MVPPTPPAAVVPDNIPKQSTAGLILAGVFLGALLVWSLLDLFSPYLIHGSARRARESALKGNLQQLRNGIEQFHDDTGVYPATLNDLVTPDEKSLKTKVKAGSYKGPYLAIRGGIGGHGLPYNPFANPLCTTITDHWNYNPMTGRVTVPDSMADRATLDDDMTYGQL